MFWNRCYLPTVLLVEEALETVGFVFDALVADGTEEVLTVGKLVVA
jgi:hypothetical protein